MTTRFEKHQSERAEIEEKISEAQNAYRAYVASIPERTLRLPRGENNDIAVVCSISRFEDGLSISGREFTLEEAKQIRDWISYWIEEDQ